MAKPKIAILGGGAAGVTAALQLSNQGNWRDHYESITLYQQGWRLGGKGACGRGPHRRIEEHGLHLWFGFYENAFRLLDRCHRELDARAKRPQDPQARWNLAFTSVEESFSPLRDLAVADYDGCHWQVWHADFCDDDDTDRPWDDHLQQHWGVAFYLERSLRLAADFAVSLVESDPRLGVAIGPVDEARTEVVHLDDAVEALLVALHGDVHTLLGAAADLVQVTSEDVFEDEVVLWSLDLVLRALDVALDFVRRRFDNTARASRSIRRAFYVVDLLVAIVRGVIEDRVPEHRSFDVIDDDDLRAWLLRHGAMRETVDCSLIRALVYDLAFAYENGDPNRPACGAGTAVRGLLRAFFTYHGSLMWRMNSGMGDVVFLPFYELLVKRGVDVKFFHRVEKLTVAGGVVTKIGIDIQAEEPPGTTPESYVTPSPVVTTGEAGGRTPTFAWPASANVVLRRPLGGPQTAPATGGREYESWFADPADTKVGDLQLANGVDFDHVVFALPISTVPNIAAGVVAAAPSWRRAVDRVRTVPTQALQLWLTKATPALAGAEPGIVMSGYVEPFDTWADMSQLPVREEVPGSATVAYFCNVLRDSPAPPRGQAADWLIEQHDLVYTQAKRFLSRDVAPLWPGAVDPATGAFAWGLLVDPAGQPGERRLKAQYWRANVEPSERYVLSLPGTSGYRIEPGDTGFSNLYAAGDWTACYLNAGCVEAAVISGMKAANAIHTACQNEAAVEWIIGIDGA
jgi:uncharacterized protein with NAD-binding domain and iron-sulfur cluster